MDFIRCTLASTYYYDIHTYIHMYTHVCKVPNAHNVLHVIVIVKLLHVVVVVPVVETKNWSSNVCGSRNMNEKNKYYITGTSLGYIIYGTIDINLVYKFQLM